MAGFPYGYYIPDGYGNGVVDANNAALFNLMQGYLGYTTLDCYGPNHQEFDHREADEIGGVVPPKPHPPDVENFPVPGGSTAQGVPQATYGGKGSSKRGFNREPSITFAVGNQGWMSLLDAMNEKYEGLEGRDDDMFVGCGCTAISLRVQWPGCKPWTRHINTVDWKNPRGPIKRSKLANKIARIMDSFIKANEGTTKVEEHWRVGTGHIELKDLFLDSIEHVTKGSWQPRVFVLRPVD